MERRGSVKGKIERRGERICRRGGRGETTHRERKEKGGALR